VQAKSPLKKDSISKEYTLTPSEIVKEKQIEEMFGKLDTDKSNALDMQEMSELFNENGVTMTKKQVAEMFSACKRFFNKSGNQ
jgi:Ca2+-binding EF-hand superfamily protein